MPHFIRHHPTDRDGDVYRCRACAWTAVRTTRGVMVLRPGDPGVLHPVEVAREAPGAVELLPAIEQYLRSL
jgi:hypothetical protein